MCEMTYRFCKTLENTYEGLQFGEVAGLQFATLWKLNLFLDIKQGFTGVFTKICRINSIYLVSVGSCSYSNNLINQLIESI